MLGRWEGFRADPCPRRLLALWELANSPAERQQWLERAERYSEQGGEPELPGPFVGGTGREDDTPFLESGEGFNDAASNATTMCARLLAGDWEGALEKAKGEPPLGWSSGDNTQALVIPVLMSWFAGWPDAELGPHLAELMKQTLIRADEWDEKEPRTSARLRAALAEAIRLWRPPSDMSKPVEAVAKICLNRVNAIVEAQHRGAYDRAALLAAAVAEMHRSRGRAAEAEAVFTGLLTRHNRKSAFKSELNARRATGVRA